MNFSKKYNDLKFLFAFLFLFPLSQAYANENINSNAELSDRLVKIEKILKYKTDASNALTAGAEQIGKFCPNFKDEQKNSLNSIKSEFLREDLLLFDGQIKDVIETKTVLERRLNARISDICPTISSLFGLSLLVPENCKRSKDLKKFFDELALSVSEYEKISKNVFKTYSKLSFYQDQECISPNFLARLYLNERETQTEMFSQEIKILLSTLNDFNRIYELLENE